MTRPDGERIAVLETQLESVLHNQAVMATKVDAVMDLLTQAKGVRWLIIVGAALGGFLITYLPWIASHIGIAK